MMSVKNNILKKPIPVVFGVKSHKLNNKEKEFYKKSNPLGFILFERNCKSFSQTKSLIKDLKKTTSHKNTIIMVDQEGGRVSRLKKPNWKLYPSAETFGITAEKNLPLAKKLTFINSLKIAKDLKKLGINMNCAPVLDVKYNFTNNVIGDRSFSSKPEIVSELGKSFCNAHKKIGIIPLIKHIPGHGASSKDSHKTTPNVNIDIVSLNKIDFFPFRKLNKESAAMVAHIIYTKIDKAIACYSKKVIEKIIRKKIGFKGVLISADINMKALRGTIKNKVLSILKSGCEVILHCNANMKEMVQIHSSIPLIKNTTLKKINKLSNLR